MENNKTMKRLCKALVSTANVVAELIYNKKGDDYFDLDCSEDDIPIDDHMKDMLDYLDGMFYEIKALHKQQNEFCEKLKSLEEKIGGIDKTATGADGR